ncbi:hypothetical protein QTP86_004834 [Hemibagrus guttatus]|nr:hypothetical protein QTP86_004834 [Hemibagrus guttatus]
MLLHYEDVAAVDYWTTSAGLLAEIEAHQEEGTEVLLSAQQEADLKKTVEECDMRFEEVKELVETNLWKRYGQTEVLATVSAAEKACEHRDTIPVDAVGYESYEVQLELLMRPVKEATGELVNWERWTPSTERAELEDRVQKLKGFNNELEARKGEFA